jgi:MFS family permease
MTAEEAALAEARRKYDLQVGRLSGFRSGSATLLAAAGIVSGLFGMQLTDSGIGVWRTVFLVAALVAFVGLVVVVTVGIQWPRRYDEGEELDRWLGFIKNRDPQADAFTYNMAKALNESYKNNAQTVKEAANWFRWACVLIGVEVVCWTVSALL